MSNKVSHLIQTKKIGSPTKKAIMMYMADKASDDGKGIWVSKPNMAADLELSLRALQTNISSLVADQLIEENGQRKIRHGYTVDYGIRLEMVLCLPSTRTPAADAPLHEMHPYPRTECTPTPAADAGKPSIEPSKEPLLSDMDVLDFELFWDHYPRKVAKGNARKAFKKAVEKVDVALILFMVHDYAESVKNKDPKFIPHPATWLNGERWADQLEQSKDDSTDENMMLNVLKEVGLKYDA